MPSFITRLTIKLQMLFGRRRAAEQLNDELSFHLEQQIRENIAAGMNKREARKAALRTFGSPDLAREQTRATWSWYSLETFGRDLKYGTRTLFRSPGFAFVSILVMALGLGATTSLFTVVRAVLLQPLPFRDPAHLVMLYEHFRSDNNSDGGYNIVSPGDYRAWRADSHGFEDMAALRTTGGMLSGEHSELPEVLQGEGGAANLLPTPRCNSHLWPNLHRRRRPAAMALRPSCSHGTSFSAASPATLPSSASKIHLDTEPATVVGVLPPWFYISRCSRSVLDALRANIHARSIRHIRRTSEPCCRAPQVRRDRRRRHSRSKRDPVSAPRCQRIQTHCGRRLVPSHD